MFKMFLLLICMAFLICISKKCPKKYIRIFYTYIYIFHFFYYIFSKHCKQLQILCAGEMGKETARYHTLHYIGWYGKNYFDYINGASTGFLLMVVRWLKKMIDSMLLDKERPINVRIGFRVLDRYVWLSVYLWIFSFVIVLECLFLQCLFECFGWQQTYIFRFKTPIRTRAFRQDQRSFIDDTVDYLNTLMGQWKFDLKTCDKPGCSEKWKTKCAFCWFSMYCSVKCQRSHWEEHRNSCPRHHVPKCGK